MDASRATACDCAAQRDKAIAGRTAARRTSRSRRSCVWTGCTLAAPSATSSGHRHIGLRTFRAVTCIFWSLRAFRTTLNCIVSTRGSILARL
eukprot:4498535-Pleurochrysis_carterae.AAC.1